MVVVVTFGTYDLFHVGHLNLLTRAKALGTKLVVGVSTDRFSEYKKKHTCIFPEDERKKILGALECVDEVFDEEAMEKKREYLVRYKADILVMGDDWKGKFDEFSDICKVVYLPRTPGVSTTDLVKKVKNTAWTRE